MTRRRLLLWSGVGALAAVSVLDHAGAFGYRKGDRTHYESAVAAVNGILSTSVIELDLPDAKHPTTRVRLRGVADSHRDVAPSNMPSQSSTTANGDDPAVAFLRQHVLGRRVRLHFDPNRNMRDADGLLSAYVYLLDGMEDELNPPMLNDLLIFEGHARADHAKPHVFSHTFDQREKLAQKAKRGIWGAGTSK